MHDDEGRPPHQARRLLTEEVRRNAPAAVARLEDQQRELRTLQSRIRRVEAELRSVGIDRGRIGRQLKEAKAELSILRSLQMTDTVDGTVSSGDPVPESESGAAAEHGSSSAPETAGSSSDSPEATAGDAEGPSSDAEEATQPAAVVEAAAMPTLAEMTTDQILSGLQMHESSEWLGGALNRLWYQKGDLEQCIALLIRHGDAIEGMGSRQRHLAQRIWGVAELADKLEQIVPARTSGAAYLPERGRVMYCAYSTPAFHSNGYSVRTKGVVSGLREAGADVFVAARSGYPWDSRSGTKVPPRRRRHAVQIDDVEYVHFPEGDLESMRVDDYVQVAADSYVREARLKRPALIHAASNFVTALPALIAARRLGLPFVYEVRGLWEVTEASAKPGWADSGRYAWQANMEASVASQADAVLAITQETKDELVRRGVPAERIEILPNGVDTESFLPIPRDEAYAKAHGIASDVPVIGFAGSFVEYEGLELLLQAANILRGRRVGFQIALAGGGGVYSELKGYKERNKLGPRVRFVGRRPVEEIPQFLSCVDIVACPRKSLPVTEMVSPLKPLEAFAASKPVVLSDVSPHRALAGSQQERGLLFTPGSAKSLADALQTLLEDSELRTAKGRAGRLWAVDERQWADLGARIRQVYTQAADSAAQQAEIGRCIGDLRIGLIADEFTTKTLQRAAQITPLERERFENQLREDDLDLVLIESAWSGNDGQWHRGVGYYSEEEDADLSRLLTQCQDLGIPSLFWNKEDPVHIERFRRTGARADHVFTTDADMIGEYLREAHTVPAGRALTASSLPFYADPAVHNPLPSARPYEDTIAYAGTFYGERYPQRSRQLEQLLRAADEASDGGLVIYDRQLAVKDSPYHFPREFLSAVRGSLPYDEVLDSYKSHLANLNVNSVAESPTMFSRRVVEIAASGAVVMSAWSRGITETFGDQIPNTNNEIYWKAYLGAWAHDAQERLAEAWRQMRTVLRSHTVETALILMARTAGIPVRGLRLPAWGCELTVGSADRVLTQSVLPAAVRVSESDDQLSAKAAALGIQVLGTEQQGLGDVEWWAQVPAEMSRTWAEDLLWATRWGTWQGIGARLLSTEPRDGRIIARPGPAPADLQGVMVPASSAGDQQGQDEGRSEGFLTLTLPDAPGDETGEGDESVRTAPVEPVSRVLIAGHDLKFARSWIDHLRAEGVEVLIDEWESHAHHDEQRSLELLAQVDTVFCEWGLGNAVWYSKHVSPQQRLVVRVHAQELRRPYLRRIDHSAVDQYIFVGEMMRDAAVRSHGVPRARTTVIPNIVRAAALERPKSPEADLTVGLVGIVPQIKRLDRAVSVIEGLVDRDARWTLRIKGKRPEEYAWMLNREDEMAWYQDCYRRIEALNARAGREAVIFDPHGDDMAEWFQGIGYALSVSDLESFHLTLPDGAASGAMPVSLAWPGADRIYPREWLVSDIDGIVQRLVELRESGIAADSIQAAASAFVKRTMAEDIVHASLDRTLDRAKERP